MKPADFCKQPSSWFGGVEGEYAEVVISSRIRLARNIKGYPFVPCLSVEQQRELLDRLKDVVLSVEAGQMFYVDIDLAAAVERELLTERHLISRRHAQAKGPRGVVISSDETFGAMINEEDHLRMQVYAAGLKLEACWERINRIDDQIEKQTE